jgi:hypothetical protein
MRELRLVPLQNDRIHQAYPLIQAVRPGLSLEQWAAYAARVLRDAEADNGGIATLQDATGLMVGLFVYHVASEPDHGRTLMVEDFVALDIIAPHAVAEHLAQAMESIARQLRCRAVHTAVSCGEGKTGQYLVDMLHELGHRLESFRLCKSISAQGGAA